MHVVTALEILREVDADSYSVRMMAGCTPRDGEPRFDAWLVTMFGDPVKHELSKHPYANDRPPW